MTNKELKDIAIHMQEIDKQLNILYIRKEELQKSLTREERNKLFDLIMADGESHYF